MRWLWLAAGLAGTLFIPGYAWTYALFPKRKQLRPLERGVLSFCLSSALVPTAIYLLNRFGSIRLSVFSTLCVAGGLTLAAGTSWAVRRQRAPANSDEESASGFIP